MTTSLLTPEQAADRLGISVRQLRDLTDEGLLRWINIGLGEKRPTRRYTEADLQEFIMERSRKCRSTNEKARTPTRTTSSFVVSDFLAIREKLRSERRNGSRPQREKPRN
ncbi:helix-turn-helix domain-containing protein [Sinorhizobium meliloti]|nr:helix-turn-helix domain-containing protein [Sinorhizobium meliloti]